MVEGLPEDERIFDRWLCRLSVKGELVGGGREELGFRGEDSSTQGRRMGCRGGVDS